MMLLKDLLDTLQVEAISNRLTPTEDVVWRKICRAYSNRFSTPLHEVLELSPEFVILHFYEQALEGLDVDENAESWLDMVLSIQDPNYDSNKEEELQQFIEHAESVEKDRVASGRPIHKDIAKEATLIPKELPKQGGINLSYLEREEQ